MNADRKYVAISIKHTEYRWKFGMPCTLWGWKQTADEEPRCFSDYTLYWAKAERYALGDFKRHGYGVDIKDDEPVPMSINLCKKWRNYDTVLVDAEQYYHYCKMSGIPTVAQEGDSHDNN